MCWKHQQSSPASGGVGRLPGGSQLQVNVLSCFGSGQELETWGEGLKESILERGQSCYRGQEGRKSWSVPSMSPKSRQTKKQVSLKHSASCDDSENLDPAWGSAQALIKLLETSTTLEGHSFPLALGDQKDLSCNSENDTLVFALVPNIIVLKGLNCHVAKIGSEVIYKMGGRTSTCKQSQD